MKKINENIFPKGGHVFQESDGVKITGSTWPGVIQRVIKYRQRAGLPAGNPQEEVMNQACQKNPGLCTDENGVYQATLKIATLKSRVLKWFVEIKQKFASEPPQFSYETDANNRAAVCATCPFNKSLPEGCGSCRAAVEESRRSIIGGRNWDARVNACEILSEDLNTTRWIEQITVDNPELPAHCWRKKTM